MAANPVVKTFAAVAATLPPPAHVWLQGHLVADTHGLPGAPDARGWILDDGSGVRLFVVGADAAAAMLAACAASQGDPDDELDVAHGGDSTQRAHAALLADPRTSVAADVMTVGAYVAVRGHLVDVAALVGSQHDACEERFGRVALAAQQAYAVTGRDVEATWIVSVVSAATPGAT